MFCLELIVCLWILLSANFRGVLGTLTVGPENVAVEVGSTVYLACNQDDPNSGWNINNLNPSNAVTCTASGTTTTCAPADASISIITTGATQKDLSITNVQTSHGGTYTCQDGSTPRSAELYVMNTPVCGAGVTVTDGSPSTVDLTCTLNYVGKFEATLTMAGGTGTLATPTKNYVQYTSSSVTYSAVTSPTVTTTYTCSVTLPLGTTTGNAANNVPTYTGTCTQVVTVVTTAPTTTTTTLAPGVTTTPAAPVTTGNSTNVTAGSSTSGFNMIYIIAIIAGVVGLGMLIALLCCIYLVSSSSSRASALPTMTRNAYGASSPKRQGYYREGRGSFEPEEPRERKKSMLSRVLSRGDKTYFD